MELRQEIRILRRHSAFAPAARADARAREPFETRITLTMITESQLLDTALLDRVLAALGFSAPPEISLGGLSALYRAWCRHVPFDNVRKLIALRAEEAGPLPGIDAGDFLEHWLTDGTGGTCWPSSNALFEIARSLGFDARRIIGSMRDLGIPNHASVEVRIDGHSWLIDSSLLFNSPVPLGQDVFRRTDDPIFPIEVEPVDDGGHLLWIDLPPNPAYMPCRLYDGAVTHTLYLESYERSRERSPFNQRLYARRNKPNELVMLMDNTKYSKTPGGLRSQVLNASDIIRSLREDIGISESLIDKWAQSGSLDTSFEPPSGPKPPPLTGKPPSQR